MPAKLIEQKDNRVTIQFTVELTGQMLTDERGFAAIAQRSRPDRHGPR